MAEPAEPRRPQTQTPSDREDSAASGGSGGASGGVGDRRSTTLPHPVERRASIRLQVDELNRFCSWRDVLSCFGGSWDRVIDAYCYGHLPPHAEDALETGMDAGRFQCLLLRRQIRLQLEILNIARAFEGDRQRASGGSAGGSSGISGEGGY